MCGCPDGWEKPCKNKVAAQSWWGGWAFGKLISKDQTDPPRRGFFSPLCRRTSLLRPRPTANLRPNDGQSPEKELVLPKHAPSSILPWDKTSLRAQKTRASVLEGFNSGVELMGSRRRMPVYPAHTSARLGSLSPRHPAPSSPRDRSVGQSHFSGQTIRTRS